MMMITSNLVSRVFPLEDGREGKELLQFKTTTTKENNKKLIEKLSRS